MKFLRAFAVLIVSIASLAGESRAASADDIIKVLADKGILRADEAAALKENGKKHEVVSARPVELSGYAQFRYLWQEQGGKKDGFDVRRARLTLKGDVGDGFSYKFQNEFGGTSGSKLLDAEITYKYASPLKITAGQFKIPFSQENLQSSAKLDTINRSQAVEALVARGKDVIGNQSGRDIGVKLHGDLLKFENGGGVEYALGVFNGAGINAADTNEQKDLVGRLVIKPGKTFAVGVSAYQGRYTLAADTAGKILERSRQGVEFAYAADDYSLKGEYIQGKNDATEAKGWYVQAAYAAIPGLLQTVLKYDSYDPSASAANDRHDVATFGANIEFSRNARLQLNYELKKEEGTDKANNTAAAQLQVAF